jgi:hypothetical protein
MKLPKCLRKRGPQGKFKAATEKHNKSYLKKFSQTAFNERIVFAPHCMRNTAACKAKEHNTYYTCAECGACKIDTVSKLTRELGYQALYIAKGGSAVAKQVKLDNPKAVLGIACYVEGAQGTELVGGETVNVAIYFVPLTRDGCSDTDVDLAEVERAMKLK